MKDANSMIALLFRQCVYPGENAWKKIPDVCVCPQDLLEVADALLDEGRVSESDLFRAFARVRIGYLWFRLTMEDPFYYPTGSLVVEIARVLGNMEEVLHWASYVADNGISMIRIMFRGGRAIDLSAVDALNAYADEVVDQQSRSIGKDEW